MKSVICGIDVEIDGNRRALNKLKAELEKKDPEIQETDEIIRNLEHDKESTEKVIMMKMMRFLSTEVKKIINLSAMDILASILK